MSTYTVTDTIINSPEAEAYFGRADDRALIGFRAALEMLGIPLPTFAIRRKPGRTPAKDVVAAFKADHPGPITTALAPRKPNATPERIAAITASKPGLYAAAFLSQAAR